MPEKSKTLWEQFMGKFRDVVFILMFFVTSAGWVVSSTTNKTKMKVVLEENSKALNELKAEVKEINGALKDQAELNGQIIQYMKED